MPLWQGVVGATLVAALALAVSGPFSPFWGNGPWWQLLFFSCSVLAERCSGASRREAATDTGDGWPDLQSVSLRLLLLTSGPP